MKGFKDSTKVKYMCGGPVKKAGGGGVYNERGKRATMAEIAAEGRRMEGRKPPVEGISTRPTDDSGRRMTNAELGMTPGGAAPKKPMPKGSGIVPAMLAASKAANAVARKGLTAKAMDSDREVALARRGVPAHSDKPMIRRSEGGLTAMPKGKC